MQETKIIDWRGQSHRGSRFLVRLNPMMLSKKGMTLENGITYGKDYCINKIANDFFGMRFVPIKMIFSLIVAAYGLLKKDPDFFKYQSLDDLAFLEKLEKVLSEDDGE